MKNVTWDEVNGLITMMVKIEVEKEREACAKLCETLGSNSTNDETITRYIGNLAYKDCAEKIRARQ